jgi:anaerobic selenocysteine-containing dehydrogenase
MCAKGQAGINQVYDPDRILYPLKRVGKRGDGR